MILNILTIFIYLLSIACSSPSPLGLIAELTLWQELVWVSRLNSLGGMSLGIGISVEVVMVDVLWVELAMSSVALNIESTVWDVVPSGLGLVSEEDVGTIVPLEPSPHSLGKSPGRLSVGSLVQPMVEWALKVIGEVSDVSWELSLQSWDHIVERQGVGGQVHPSGVGGEDGKGLARPHTIGLVPAGNVWLLLLHISKKIVNVEFPCASIALGLEILFENRSPLGVGNIISNVLGGLTDFHLMNWHALGNGDVAGELSVSLMVSVIDWTTLEVNNSSTSFHIIDGSG